MPLEERERINEEAEKEISPESPFTIPQREKHQSEMQENNSEYNSSIKPYVPSRGDPESNRLFKEDQFSVKEVGFDVVQKGSVLS